MTPITIPRMLGYPEKEIYHYLDTVEYDHSFSAWPAGDYVARSTLAHDALRQALVKAVKQRTQHAVEPGALLDVCGACFHVPSSRHGRKSAFWGRLEPGRKR